MPDAAGWCLEKVLRKNIGAVVTSSIVLISAVLASLASGVFVAYGICMTMFRLFRIHARQVAAQSSTRRVVAQAGVVKG
jgi:hypothetical protein